LIGLQWHILVLTLRLAVYTLFWKARSNLGKHFLHPQKYALPYTYEYDASVSVMKNVLSNKKVIQMLMFELQKKIWKRNHN